MPSRAKIRSKRFPVQNMLGLVTLSLHDTILSPSLTKRCSGLTESLVFLCVCVGGGG